MLQPIPDIPPSLQVRVKSVNEVSDIKNCFIARLSNTLGITGGWQNPTHTQQQK